MFMAIWPNVPIQAADYRRSTSNYTNKLGWWNVAGATLHAYGYSGKATDAWLTHWANFPNRIRENSTKTVEDRARTEYTVSVEVPIPWGGITIESFKDYMQIRYY